MKVFLPVLSFLVFYISGFVTNFFPNNQYSVHVVYALSGMILVVWAYLYGRQVWITCRRTLFSNSKYGLLSVLAAMVLFLTTAYITTDPEYDVKLDWSDSGKNSLRVESKNIVQKLISEKKKIEIIGFFENLNEKKDFEDLLSMYEAEGLQVDKSYFHPHRSPIKARFYAVKDPNTVIIKHNKTTAQIVDVDEKKLTNTILKVSQQKMKNIYFTSGHGELSLSDKDVTGLSSLSEYLSKNIYQVKELSLISAEKIPLSADLVVVAGPEFDFHENSIAALKNYILNGGSVLVLTEALRPIDNIKKLTSSFGLNIQDDIVILNQEDPRASMFGQNNALVDGFNQFHPVSTSFAGSSKAAVLFPNARSIIASKDQSLGYKSDFLGQTTKSNVRVDGVKNQSDLKKLNNSQFKFEPSTILASSTKTLKNGSSKLIVSGSVQFINNQNFVRPENRKILMSVLQYLADEQDMINISPIENANKEIDLKSIESQVALNFISFILPLLFLALALQRWLRGNSI